MGIVSALTNRPVNPGFAFAGEVALHGEVGAVTGMLPKIAAAARAGRKHVLIPKANAGVIVGLPPELKAAVETHPIATAREALTLALGPAATFP